MRDILAEVMASMKSNRMRIALTGFSIGWGIFILIVLLGAGNGLLKGMMSNFSDTTDNIYTVTPGKTAMFYKGWPKNREIVFTHDDVERLESSFPDKIEHISATLSATAELTYGTVTTNGSIEGKEVGFDRTEHIRIVQGRQLSQMDADSLRKTCVVSSSLARILFRDDQHPVGKYLSGNGVQLLVVGIYELTGEDAEMSDTLWSMLEATGNLRVAWQNLIGYFAEKRFFNPTLGSPALNDMFFGNK